MMHAIKPMHGSYPAMLCLMILALAACTGSPAAPTTTATAPISAPAQSTQTNPAPQAAPSTTPSPAATVAATPTPAPTASGTPPPPIRTATVAPMDVHALPDGNAFQWKLVASGLTRPVAIANAGDGSSRLFILEQPGVIAILQNGLLLATPFLDIRDRVGSAGNEQGLLGLAFHPGYKTDGLFYLDYTDKNGNTNIAQFKASSDPNRAEPASEKVLLHILQPYPNHNGGQLAFGPDGYLYIGMGDGGSQGDPHGNGQSLKTLLGKLLRIDVDHGDPYGIPPDNPLAKGGGRPEILAYGLRNPWRFSYDAPSAQWYIADVGQDKYEEIDILAAGKTALTNYGWNLREGFHPYTGAAYHGPVPLTDPVMEYDHSFGCAIIGGYVYRGPSLPEFHGIYLYGDDCSGRIWGMLKIGDRWTSAQLFSSHLNITTFGLDEAGEIYLAALNGDVLTLTRK